MADESKKGTGDPLRDAIIASAKVEQSARDEIYENALATELEIARLRATGAMQEQWRPPTEEEFNHEWFTVDDALGSLFEIIEPAHKRRWLKERLIAGVVTAVARTGQPNAAYQKMEDFVPIDPALWDKLQYHEELHFWETNGQNAVFTHFDRYGAATKQRFFDVRFEAAGFDGQRVPRPIFTEDGGQVRQEDAGELPQLSKADAERFCKAILAGWPDAGQDFAHEKAVMFFPDRKVPRDWFRSILRSIRGPTKRGKKPKSDE
jgi:hypothetical protein